MLVPKEKMDEILQEFDVENSMWFHSVLTEKKYSQLLYIVDKISQYFKTEISVTGQFKLERK